jgi:hypothetical protein
MYFRSSSNDFRWVQQGSPMQFDAVTNSVYRDPSAWYHLVFVQDGNNATPSNRNIVYVNGVAQSLIAGPTAYGVNPSQTASNGVWWTTPSGSAANNKNTIGALDSSGTGPIGGFYFNGYIADVFLVDGVSLPATAFGYFDPNGVWVPYSFNTAKGNVVSAGGFGTNGFALEFNSANFNSGTLVWADQSGNGNDFTASWNCAAGANSPFIDTDIVSDSPIDNYALWNPLRVYQQPTFVSVNVGGKLGAANSTTWGSNTTAFDGYTLHTVPISTSGSYDLNLNVSNPNYAPPTAFAFATAIGTLSNYNTGPANLLQKPCFTYYWGDSGTTTSAGIYQNGAVVQAATGFATSANSSYSFRVVVDRTANTATFYVPVSGFSLTPSTIAATVSISSLAGQELYLAVTSTGVAGNTSGTFFIRGSDLLSLNTNSLAAATVPDGSTGFQAILGPGQGPTGGIGSAYQGGFYAGKISTAGNGIADYNLVVAPLVSGSLEGQYGGTTPSATVYKTSDTGDTPTATVQDQVYGGLATDLLKASANNPVFSVFINGLTGPNAGAFNLTTGGAGGGTGIGGYNDWYLPAKNELEILYYNLKPNTTSNDTTISGVNPNAVPPQASNYLAGGPPVQTLNALFQTSGAQVFSVPNGYWSSSELVGSPGGAWAQNFSNGYQFGAAKSSVSTYARAIRRVPVATGGILELAQAAVPNGLWWIKDRQNANQHQLVDSVNTSASTLSSPAATTGAYAAPTGNSVAWVWATPASGISASTGFSITTGTHGLGQSPQFVIDRQLNVYHASLGAAVGLKLSTTAASAAQVWTVNSTTVSGPAGAGTYYSWAAITGYSSFGSYAGNGSADGPFVYTGFKPAFVLIKCSSTTGNWEIYDNARNTYNPETLALQPNLTNAESTIDGVDFLSNGFKIRTTDANFNTSGQTYIYAAFAENPFGGSNVAPVTAR